MPQFNMQMDETYRKKIGELGKRWGLQSQAQVMRKAIDVALVGQAGPKKDLKFWQDYAEECRKIPRRPGAKPMSKEEFYKKVVGF